MSTNNAVIDGEVCLSENGDRDDWPLINETALRRFHRWSGPTRCVCGAIIPEADTICSVSGIDLGR